MHPPRRLAARYIFERRPRANRHRPEQERTLNCRQEHRDPTVVNRDVSIDKDSNGIPEFDSGRRTTKVNLWMIVAVGLFFVFGFLAILYFNGHHPG